MKITKTQLTKLIKEELEKSIEEEIVQEVYFPFIGGKLPDGEWSIRSKQMQAIQDAVRDLSEEERQRFADLNQHVLKLPEDSEYGDLDTALEEKFSAFGKQLSKLSYNRHKKDEAHSVLGLMDQALDRMSKVAGGVAQQIADEKADFAAHRKSEDEKHARIRAQSEKERKQQRAHDDERRAASAQQDDSDDAFMGQHHRSNPGFAGSGNMGYGESLDRKKISKSELAQIIKEELENVLK